MSAIASLITRFCSMLVMYFSAMEKVGKAIDNLATVAEGASGTYADTSRIERTANVRELYKKHGIVMPEAQLVN